MSKEEFLDIYNGIGEHIGTMSRNDVHNQGLWHKTFHCWIIYKDENNEGFIVFQKRSDNKKSWPGYFDISAAGHIEAGETIEDGLRELKEELGVEVEFDKLTSLGTRVCIEEFKENSINHEFQSIFFLKDNRNLKNYHLQGDELSGICKIKISELLLLFSGKITEIDVEGLVVNKEKQKVDTTFKFTLDKLIPTLDEYYYKITILADRALKGENHLRI
jgi:isopentenyldiphosphate isomerase